MLSGFELYPRWVPRNTIIVGCKISQLNSPAAAFKQLSPGLAGKYEVKISAYSSSVHKTCSFYNFYFSIEQKIQSIFWSLSVITAKNEKKIGLISQYAFSRKVVRKSARDNPERYCG